MLAKPLAACTHLSSTVSQLFEPQMQKIAVFTYRSPHFCFPWRRPCFNSFRVIRSLSQCVSPKIAIFTTFLFPLGTPPGAITQNVVINEKTIQCLPNPSQHAPIYLQQFPSYSNYNCKKIVIFTYPGLHFLFALGQ